MCKPGLAHTHGELGICIDSSYEFGDEIGYGVFLGKLFVGYSACLFVLPYRLYCCVYFGK